MNFSIECIHEVTQNDSSLRNEILQLFIDNLPNYIDELEFSFKQNDLEGLKKSAHKLKTPLLTLKVEGIINLLEFVEIEVDEYTPQNEINKTLIQIVFGVQQIIYKLKLINMVN